MKIVIFALGSRGDVQPYVALGAGLRAAGHVVSLLASTDFRKLVTSHGLEFVALGGSTEAVAQELQHLVEQGRTFKVFSSQARLAEEQAYAAAAHGLSAAQSADMIVAGLGGMFVAWSLAEKLGVPFVQAHLVPFTPTRHFSSVLAPPLPHTPLAGWTNSLSHHMVEQMLWQMFRSADARARAEVLGLPPAPFWGPFDALRDARPTLYGYSAHVLPRPSDWAPDIHVTGYWFLAPPAGWEPPVDLVRFLDAGPPPVYIGFGSMPSSRPEEAAAMAVEALTRIGRRGLLYGGWGGLRAEQLPEHVHLTGSVPHSWLFPRVAAVVHHGGVGTTAAGLAAGIPSIVTPFFGDQPFWGQRVHELGVGPRPIPRRRLTADSLAEAVCVATSDQQMQARAAELGERLRAEDGVDRAVAVIERHRQRIGG
ncbi:MAG TPA: glycosyltransferase [Chloroflexaceae bacterium]|nr:glycosyltransferase [Chloroflexaceae bacterium]